jgi:hypothetical protein
MKTAPPAPSVQATEPASRRARRRAGASRSRVWAARVHVASLIVGLGVLEWFAHHRWFSLDDFDIVGRSLPLLPGAVKSASDVFQPHVDHWTTAAFLVDGGLARTLGMGSYAPYVTGAILLELTAAALLRVVARRAGVDPWTATGTVAVLIFLGGASQETIWGAFVTFAAALVCGLAHLLLADHDGPWDRRDWIGLAFGIFGFMWQGFALTMTGVVFIALLLRRGWRRALAHALPGVAVYSAWYGLESAHVSGKITFSPLADFFRFISEGLTRSVGTYTGLTDVGTALFVVLVAGVGYVFLARWRSELTGRLAPPFALFAGAVGFFTITAAGRLSWGLATATSPRYLFIGAALLLPAAAVCLSRLASLGLAARALVAALLIAALAINLVRFQHVADTADRADAGTRALVEASAALPAVQAGRPIHAKDFVPGLSYSLLERLVRSGGLPARHGAPAVELTARGAASLQSGPGYPKGVSDANLHLDLVHGTTARPIGAGCVKVAPVSGSPARLPVQVGTRLALTVQSPKGRSIFLEWRDRATGRHSRAQAAAGYGRDVNYVQSSAPYDVDLLLPHAWYGTICGLNVYEPGQAIPVGGY